jgi:hypothetical protein
MDHQRKFPTHMQQELTQVKHYCLWTAEMAADIHFAPKMCSWLQHVVNVRTKIHASVHRTEVCDTGAEFEYDLEHV